MIYGISDQFAGHGSEYNPHPGAPAIVEREHSAETIVASFLKHAVFWRQEGPGMIVKDDKPFLCYYDTSTGHARQILTPLYGS